jgi:hypothetical protein
MKKKERRHDKMGQTRSEREERIHEEKGLVKILKKGEEMKDEGGVKGEVEMKRGEEKRGRRH